MMDKSVKTWRVFLFGMCCILIGVYLRRTLTYFQIIKGNLLSNSIVLFAVVWFAACIWRLYRLNQTDPESKTAFSRDRWCIAETALIFILAMGLKLFR